MRAVQALQRTARFTGFLSGWLAVLVGIIHILTIEAHLVWPTREEGATGWSVIEDDVNKYIWRLKLFSLEPDVFIDSWTPLVLGSLTIAAHSGARLPFVSTSFAVHTLWMLFLGLFGVVGYRGGIGIVCSIPVWISAFCSLGAFLVADDEATYQWRLGRRLRRTRRKIVLDRKKRKVPVAAVETV
ncbi:MAG: uncharacterized protein KVP18_004313 [Porospora cf. gigantea A]|uniref:uncharacterized protein n=2 Tax=Porospora cf. gigantea A TaxID=2853593 RepID=UPI003559D605|nr:MAG: hypothetical protein KVP18_004313 [Porospora cf. gigantea A]